LKKEVSNVKSIFTFLIAASVALGFSIEGFGQGPTGSQTTVTDRKQATAKEKKMQPTGNEMSYVGKIVSLNTVDQTMVVRGKEGEKTFDISKATTDGSITTGHTVRVTYYADAKGNMVVSSVRGSMKTPL
jgi:hypothetical protein